jgi:hypothetical protein
MLFEHSILGRQFGGIEIKTKTKEETWRDDEQLSFLFGKVVEVDVMFQGYCLFLQHNTYCLSNIVTDYSGNWIVNPNL